MTVCVSVCGHGGRVWGDIKGVVCGRRSVCAHVHVCVDICLAPNRNNVVMAWYLGGCHTFYYGMHWSAKLEH